jgi:hypothetical protein
MRDGGFETIGETLNIIGVVDSVWRYPVKSMRGEELDRIVVQRSGVQGDRLFAIGNSAARPDFPYFTGRQRPEMLLFRPRIDEQTSDGTTDVEAPSGETLALDDPELLQRLAAGVASAETLGLMRSQQPLTDAQPLSIISIQTAAKLAAETGTPADKRRFRANIYIDLPGTDGFHENTFVGRSLGIGAQVVAAVVERDSRCMMITLDPDTAAKAPAILKQVARAHDGTAGVYATVVAEGVVRRGDPIKLL